MLSHTVTIAIEKETNNFFQLFVKNENKHATSHVLVQSSGKVVCLDCSEKKSASGKFSTQHEDPRRGSIG